MSAEAALHGIGPEELRAAVREVLREVLPAGTVAEPAPSGRQGGPLAGQGDVVIATDADLTAFVRRLAALCEDPHQRAELQGGKHGFRLAASAAADPGPADSGVTRIDRGAVTERTVVKAAAAGTRLRLGRGAVLTPLARDKARSLGVEIEKEH